MLPITMGYYRPHAMIRRIVARLGHLFIILATSDNADADCVPVRRPPATSENVTPEDKVLATVRYKAGNELLRKQDYEGALGLFLRWRELWHRSANTKNAAFCLFELGRYPEALALYEEILEYFSNEIDSDERALIVKTAADLRKKLLLVDVRESSGVFSIDDQSCGSLPRIEPVYLLPGSHILRILRPGKPEAIADFSGMAGQRISAQLPKPPPPPPILPEPGRWFVQGSLGPAFGWAGIGSTSAAQLEQATGVLTQANAGYWLSNGAMVGLATGLLYLEAPKEVKQGFDGLLFEYVGTRDTPLFAPFVGINAGWGTEIGKRFDIWFRGGLGLMSTQSKNAADAYLRRVLPIGGHQTTKIPISFTGRKVVRDVPGFAALDVGIATRVGRFRIGLLIGSLFLLNDGPMLPDLYLIPRDRHSADYDGICSTIAEEEDADCVPALRISGDRAYRVTFVLVPQIVIDF